MARKKSANYLDFVPRINPNNTWSEENGIVTVHMVHRGFWAAIAQKVFHRPRVSHIKLDEYGSFVWKNIDGVRTVGQLAQAMKERFGDKAEPLYDRLVHYMRILYNNQFILYGRQEKKRG